MKDSSRNRTGACLHIHPIYPLSAGADHRYESCSCYKLYLNIIHWIWSSPWVMKKKKLIPLPLNDLPRNRTGALLAHRLIFVIDSSADHSPRVWFLLSGVAEYLVRVWDRIENRKKHFAFIMTHPGVEPGACLQIYIATSLRAGADHPPRVWSLLPVAPEYIVLHVSLRRN
jgi:hypothetical protein